MPHTARFARPAFRTALAALAFCAAQFCAVAGSHAETITVFAAASLKESLDTLARRYESQSGDKVVIAFAASSALAKQIEAGAPANVFVSADLDWTDYLDRKGLLLPGTRVNLLCNELVLIAPAASTMSPRMRKGLDLASLLGKERLALANPDAVPAGKYGKAALEFLGAWDGVRTRLAPAENVRAALALVSRGETPLGIVYRTDALADKGVKIAGVFPAESHPAIVYPAAVLAASRSASAKAFLAYLSTPDARKVWERYGFSMAKDPL